MSHIIHVDESASFERTLDEQYLMWHNHQTNIPRGLTGDLPRVDLRAVGRTPVNGLPAGWRQDDEAFARYHANQQRHGFAAGCAIIAFGVFALTACWWLYQVGQAYGY